MGIRTIKNECSPSWDHQNSNFDNVGFEPMRFLESFTEMVEKESDFMPRDDYLHRLRIGNLELSVRSNALDWILKANAHFNFGTVCVCLSVNYFDRFLSVYNIPIGQLWISQLLAVACFSIAAKIEEVNVPRCVDIQVGDDLDYIFDFKTIQKMELLVLGTLEWRMQAITPYSFIEHFISKISVDQSSLKLLVSKSKQLILNTIKGIDLLEFRPSEIAAAVAISVSGDRQSLDLDKVMSSFIHVEKGKVLTCLEIIIDVSLNSVSAASMAQSSAGVLDAGFVISKRKSDLADGS